ncbi:head GIN domain-containing protein [Sabulibacter ruber]|uniref:head GIN domain-containing protein n=1 Tax=Sabulibacter ruber TaxID=2811901 RepID=UPI001A9610D4|nr:head GIN domain-containing protein [Sabulibacter ruber]
MKKTFAQFFMLLALVCLGQQVQAQTVDGNGKMKTENRNVSSFSSLQVGGGFEIVLTQGASESLKLEAEENVLPLIESSVQNGVLSIKTKSNLRNAKTLKAYVTVKDLKSLDLSGGIKLTSTNTINANALKFDFSGGINVKMDINVKQLTADVAGGTDITLSGQAETVKLDLAGAASLKAIELKTDYFTIDAAGASNAKVNVAKELNVEAAGIVSIDYKGSPKVKHSGMGKVRPIKS